MLSRYILILQPIFPNRTKHERKSYETHIQQDAGFRFHHRRFSASRHCALRTGSGRGRTRGRCCSRRRSRNGRLRWRHGRLWRRCRRWSRHGRLWRRRSRRWRRWSDHGRYGLPRHGWRSGRNARRHDARWPGRSASCWPCWSR